MYYNEKAKQTLDTDELNLLQVYLRSQAGRPLNSQQMGWFFDQPELTDDGEHPLLADEAVPHCSGDVMNRAMATWALLDNKNPIKFVLKYYHTLENMAENSPPHVRDYVRRSLETPISFHESADQIFSQYRRPDLTSGASYTFSHNSRPCFYKHAHSNSNHLRNQAFQGPVVTREFRGNDFMNPAMHANLPVENIPNGRNVDFDATSGEFKTGNGPTNVYEMYCNYLANKQLNEAKDQSEVMAMENEHYSEGMKANVANDKCEVVCQSQTSIDSTPSKNSEADSCYQSMSSPMTDHDE